MKIVSKSKGRHRRPIGKKRLRRRIIGIILLVLIVAGSVAGIWYKHAQGEETPAVELEQSAVVTPVEDDQMQPGSTTDEPDEATPTVTDSSLILSAEPIPGEEEPEPEVEEEEAEEGFALPIYDPISTDSLVAVMGLVDLEELNAGFVVNLANATTNNVTGEVQYESNTALLLRSTAEALMKAQAIFMEDGYRIMLWDAYRPKSVQASMNLSLPSELKYLIPYPGSTSQHCRGVAVDITLVDENGVELDMPTDFCEFNDATAAYSTAVTPEQEANRDYLREVMTSVGFSVLNMEWWHYYMPNHYSYELIDITFDQYELLKQVAPSELQYAALTPQPLVSTVANATSVSNLVSVSDISKDFIIGTSSSLEGTGKTSCLLHSDALIRLVNALYEAMDSGYRIKILDAYRPTSVQTSLVASNSGVLANYVEGTTGQSSGIAVDVVLVNSDGKEMDMPSDYLEFKSSWADATVEQLWNKDFLVGLMLSFGFEQPDPNVWWHFELANSMDYTPLNLSYSDFKTQYNAKIAAATTTTVEVVTETPAETAVETTVEPVEETPVVEETPAEETAVEET